jgi:hypothetical protein
MRFLRKIHKRVEPPGLELRILRRLPGLFVAATAAPLAVAWGARIWFGNGGGVAETSKQIMSIDIFCFAVGVTMWAALLTVGIGSLVVYIMKGPAYAADSYEVSHSDRPVD